MTSQGGQNNSDNWDKYAELVLKELERLGEKEEKQEEKIQKLFRDTAVLTERGLVVNHRINDLEDDFGTLDTTLTNLRLSVAKWSGSITIIGNLVFILIKWAIDHG